MAEFCLECLRELDEINYKEKDFIISKDLDLCEGCGEWKHVVEIARITYYKRKFRLLINFFNFLYKCLIVILKILFLPILYVIYKKIKKSEQA